MSQNDLVLSHSALFPRKKRETSYYLVISYLEFGTESQKALFLQQKQFQDHMDKILRELELLKQQKEAVQVHRAMHIFRCDYVRLSVRRSVHRSVGSVLFSLNEYGHF